METRKSEITVSEVSSEDTEESVNVDLKEGAIRPDDSHLQNWIAIFDILTNFSLTYLFLFLSDKNFFQSLNLNVDSILILCYFVGLFFNIGIGIVSDYTGKYWTSFISVVSLAVSCSLSCIAASDLFSIEIQIYFYFSILFCVLVSVSCYGVKTALVFSEISILSKKKHVYIFAIWLGRNLFYILALIGLLLTTWFRIATLIFASLASFSCLIAFGILIFFRKKIRKNFEKVKIDFKSEAGEKSVQVIKVLTFVIGFSVSSYVFIFVLRTESMVFKEDKPNAAGIVAVLNFYIFESIMMALIEFGFLKLFRKWEKGLVHLKLQGIAYNIMCAALVILCLGVSGLRQWDLEDQTQIRIYNGLNTTAYIKYGAMDTIKVEPASLSVVVDLHCVDTCETLTKVQYEEKKFEQILKGEQGQSFTFVLTEGTLRSLPIRDPFELVKNRTLFYVVSNAFIDAVLIFEEEYPISFRPNLTDYVIFTIPEGDSLRGFRLKRSLEVQNYTFETKKDTLYAIFVYVNGSNVLLVVDELVLKFKPVRNVSFLMIPTLIASFGTALSKLILYQFALMEFPIKLFGMLTSYLFMVMNFGVCSWIVFYFTTPIWLTFLALFTVLHFVSAFLFAKFQSDYLLWKTGEIN